MSPEVQKKKAAMVFPLVEEDLLRFQARITKHESGCWLFSKPNDNGYSHISMGGVLWAAHRLSYLHHVGPIPEGLHIDHLCFARNCVNPQHLEPVTSAENNRRREFPGVTKTSTFRIPADIKADAARAAKANGETLSAALTRMLADYAGVPLRQRRTDLLREYAREEK